MNDNPRTGRMALSTPRLLASIGMLLLTGCSASAGSVPAPSTTADPGAQQEAPASSSAPQEKPSETGEASETERTSEKGEEAGEAGSGLTEVETTDEKREDLDQKLDSSLREFDGLILREQEILEERREASSAGGGGGDAGVGGDAGGGEVGAGEESGGDAGEERTADGGGTGGSPDAPQAEPASEEDGGDVDSGDRNAELSNGRVPPDVGDGSDDDIVARQLREAAMEEEDPELREKLWDEYRAYKAGTAGKAKPKNEESGN